jgi:two-component system phosphate regulon response regulator PhoB
MTPYRDAHLSVEFERNMASLDTSALRLTRKEFELLALLVVNAGEIVPRRELLQQVWGYGDGIRTRTLDVHIRRLRMRLAPYAGEYIETIFGVGYRFQPYRAPRLVERLTAAPLAIGA